MKSMTLKEIAAAVDGRLTGNGVSRVSRVSRDSRQVNGDCLFFALKGENRDGHDYIGDVIKAGCRAVVAERIPEMPDVKTAEADFITVDDTTRALQELASYYIGVINPLTVGVTGSTGKTTTKEMTYRVLSQKYRTGRNMLNYNNHIGLPLTVLDLEADTEAAVLEMGMDKPGEIDFLADLVRPHVGIITNIGVSHIEYLKTRENIFKAKMEITGYFSHEDLLIVSKGDDFLRRENLTGNYNVAVTGKDEDCDIYISDIESSMRFGSRFRLRTGGVAAGWEGVKKGGDEQLFTLPVPGEHNVLDSALAVAAGLFAGVTMEECAEALGRMEATDKRGGVVKAGEVQIINDTYNASPDSVKAALNVLASAEGNRRIAVLGDMFELGDKGPEFHRRTGEYAAGLAVDKVVCIGELSRNTAEGAGKKGLHFSSKEDFARDMEKVLSPGDTVLLKGSRGMAMESIIDDIEEIFK